MPKQTLTAQRTIPQCATITRVSTCLRGRLSHHCAWPRQTDIPGKRKIRYCVGKLHAIHTANQPDGAAPTGTWAWGPGPSCPACVVLHILFASRRQQSGAWVGVGRAVPGSVKSGPSPASGRVELLFRAADRHLSSALAGPSHHTCWCVFFTATRLALGSERV